MNDFYIMKHIAITPYSIKIKKESFHQSSRFLRLYFHNDNFIKIEFKDENDTKDIIEKNKNSLLEDPQKFYTTQKFKIDLISVKGKWKVVLTEDFYNALSGYPN